MLEMRGVWKRFGSIVALRDIALTIADGEIVCLLGPSGCGKTTLLRVIAGLESPDSGQIFLNEQDISRVPTHQRGFGLMFQDYALFPHLSVADNIAFGLRMQHATASHRRARVDEMLALVGLEGYGQRDVSALSGGEEQRVALARSLAPRPRLLMLDEPLGSLDAALKARLLIELPGVIRTLGLTAVYVTHDQSEALAIADRIVLMNAGAIVQVDIPAVLYRRPASTFAARFLGLNNLIPVVAREGHSVCTSIGEFGVAGAGDTLLIHPDGLTINAAGTGQLEGVIHHRVFHGAWVEVQVRCGEVILTLRAPLFGPEVPAVGARVTLDVAPEAAILIEQSDA